MKTMMLLGVLLSTIAIGALFAAGSRAEDNDGGSVSCLNGLTGTEIKGDNSIAGGMVYDATKTNSAKNATSACTDPVVMNENADQDGDEE